MGIHGEIVNLTNQVTGILPKSNGGTGESNYKKTVFFNFLQSTLAAQFDNTNYYTGQRLATSDVGYITFIAPYDFTTLTKLTLVAYPFDAGGAGAGKDIDFDSYYGTIGESNTTHSGSDTSSTYNTGTLNTLFEIDISGLYASLSANDFASLRITHNTVGGNIFYLGIKMEYQ